MAGDLWERPSSWREHNENAAAAAAAASAEAYVDDDNV